MNKIYFISVDDLKDYTPINSNVDDKRLIMGIYDAQEIYIQGTLGGKLYNKLKTIVDDGTISTLTNYKILLDEYIIPTLIRWSMVEILPHTSIKIENKGVQQQTSDNSNPVELGTLKYYIALNKDKAEFYQKRMIDYLLQNSSLYPEYLSTNRFDEMIPDKNAYFSGIELDGQNINDEDLIRDHSPYRKRFF